MTEIVKVDANEFGLEEVKAAQISAQFKPMLDKMEALESEYNEVIKLDIEESETAAKAKELRLKYVKVRTGTAAIHKEQKSFYLAGGKFVDGWKNAQLFASEGIENKLMEIEKHAENVENERVEVIGQERKKQCLKFVDEDVILPNLGSMPDSIWDNYIIGLEASYNAKIEAEKKVEAERIAKEIAEKEERERIAKENEQLKKEAVERERLAKVEAEKRRKAEVERLEKEEAERIEREEKQRKEREEYETKLRIEREKQERIEREEREKREALEAELKAKEAAELKAKEDEAANIQAELNKGDIAKVADLIKDLESLKVKYSFKSAKNKKMYNDVGLLIDKVVTHIK